MNREHGHYFRWHGEVSEITLENFEIMDSSVKKTLTKHFIRNTTLILGRAIIPSNIMLSEQPQFFHGMDPRDVGNIPLRFCSMMTGLHRVISAELSAAH